MIGFVLLTPAAGILLGLLVSSRGGGVITDEDILFFFLRPLGMATLIVAGAIFAGIGFVEQAGLMTIVFGARHERSITYLEALRHVVRRATSIFNLAGQMIARLLLYAAPFLDRRWPWFISCFLTDFDINYYLAERPREFYVAAVLDRDCGGSQWLSSWPGTSSSAGPMRSPSSFSRMPAEPRR